MIRGLLLVLLCAGSVRAGGFQLPSQTEALVFEMQAMGRKPGFGVRRLPKQAPPAAAYINAGFAALGPAGTKGTVDGPGKQGNGAYEMLKNDPFEVIITIETGFISATMTFTRDSLTGADTLRFVGKKWDTMTGKWGPPTDRTNSLTVNYNPGRDRGNFHWLEDGKSYTERFWDGGQASSRSMTIELGGGWDHTFSHD